MRASHFHGQTLALLLVLGHLLAIAVAWSPDLHHWMHGDADESGHLCAAAAVLGGQLESANATVSVLAPMLFPTESVPLDQIGVRPLLPLTGRSQERAPPAA